jgi:hypothetical protein
MLCPDLIRGIFVHGKSRLGPLDRPPCEKCGGETWLARRSPHPELGLPAELWSFECQTCGHVQTRPVEADGTRLA